MVVIHAGQLFDGKSDRLLSNQVIVIQGDRIGAAACFLPLTTNPALITELGTRHRAALGITTTPS